MMSFYLRAVGSLGRPACAYSRTYISRTSSRTVRYTAPAQLTTTNRRVQPTPTMHASFDGALRDTEEANTLRSSMTRSKAAYLAGVRDGKGTDWVVVMGNEAGDLDSLASAIAYAWYLSEVLQSPAVALVQTPRNDLHLRAENTHALSLAGVGPEDLLCVDEAQSTPPAAPFPSTAFALVDHNRLGTRFSENNPAAHVIAIIDHHADEGLYKDADPRIVTPGVGSCSSLVTEFLQKTCAEKMPQELATLLLSSITIDTGGMIPGGKAIENDHKAATFLASQCTLAAAELIAAPSLHNSSTIQELNTTLQTKKNSVGHLGARDLLRRDYKEYALTPAFAPGDEVLIGLASVPLSLASLVSHDGTRFVHDVEAWMDERGLGALGVLASFRDAHKPGKSGKGKHRREQLWVVHARGERGVELAQRLFAGLEANEELRMKQKQWRKVGVEPAVWEKIGGPFGAEWRVAAWKQKNADATRKATAPIVKAIVEGRDV